MTLFPSLPDARRHARVRHPDGDGQHPAGTRSCSGSTAASVVSERQRRRLGSHRRLQQAHPRLHCGGYSYTVRYGKVFVEDAPVDGGPWTRSISETEDNYFDKRTVGYLNMAMPLNDQGVAYLRWQGTQREPLTPLAEIDAQGSPVYRQAIPLRGFMSSIGGGWGKGRGSAYGRAISIERGTYYSVSGKLTSKHLGSYTLDELDQRTPFSQFQFGGTYRRFTSVPWLDDHVISTSLSGGGTVGDRTRFGSYRLGGNFGIGGLYTLPEEYRPLRGFFPGTVYGDWYYLGSVEYRMPLWWIDRGIGTIPFFARYFSLAAFLDAGNAFNGCRAVARRQGRS